MISTIMLVNQKGEHVLSRFYRDDVSRQCCDHFRQQVIASKEVGTKAPIVLVDGVTFLYYRQQNMYIVAGTRQNMNPALAFQFLYQLVKIFSAYFGKKFDEDAIKNNFTLVYELLDETIDYGYPQNCSPDVLKLYINLGSLLASDTSQASTQLTSQITGAIDWRREGIKYRKNEVFIDILESMNVLVSAKGTVLRSDVTGQVMMKALLTGMPECKFGLNDKLIMDKESGDKAEKKSGKKGRSVELDDVSFHRCVRLGKFDADRTITFIPPDGEFELMRYRVTDNINLPIQIIPTITEQGKTRVLVNIKVKANFSNQLWATNLIVKIPAPPNTARIEIPTSVGKCKYEPEQKAVVWKARRFPGQMETLISGEIILASTVRDKVWTKPPIQVEFQVPMYASSGLQVRFLKVFEKSHYETVKWVRYITRAGTYQVRV